VCNFFYGQISSLASWTLPYSYFITKFLGSPQEALEGNRFLKKLFTWKSLALLYSRKYNSLTLKKTPN
jgi:hypothetical protein